MIAYQKFINIKKYFKVRFVPPPPIKVLKEVTCASLLHALK